MTHGDEPKGTARQQVVGEIRRQLIGTVTLATFVVVAIAVGMLTANWAWGWGRIFVLIVAAGAAAWTVSSWLRGR
jgi:hypothetical protein